MPVQIGEMFTDIDVRPPDAAPDSGGATARDSNWQQIEQLRPIVLQILREELDRLRRQHG